jgi:hypothetical protein
VWLIFGSVEVGESSDTLAGHAGGQLLPSNTKHPRYAEVVHLLIVFGALMSALDKLILGNIVRGGGVHLRHFLLRGQGPEKTHYLGYLPSWSRYPDGIRILNMFMKYVDTPYIRRDGYEMKLPLCQHDCSPPCNCYLIETAHKGA